MRNPDSGPRNPRLESLDLVHCLWLRALIAMSDVFRPLQIYGDTRTNLNNANEIELTLMTYERVLSIS